MRHKDQGHALRPDQANDLFQAAGDGGEGVRGGDSLDVVVDERAEGLTGLLAERALEVQELRGGATVVVSPAPSGF